MGGRAGSSEGGVERCSLKKLNVGDFYQNISVGGSKEKEWEGTILSELRKVSNGVLCRNVPKEYYSERFQKVIIPKGLGFVMSDL